MNKSELVQSIAEELGVTQVQASQFIDAFVATVTKTLKRGGEVQLVGFGSFKTSKRAARNGINPKTGEKIEIAARRVAKFQVGAALKSSVA